MNLTAEDIEDLYDAYDSFVASNGNGWIDLLSTPNTITALGNRSYSMVFNGVDHTDLLSPGMRLKMTRTVTAPTQCADLEASSSQYFTKATPSGMTFTDDFTCSAWIKLESIGATQTILARRNASTDGFQFRIEDDGLLSMYCQRIASNNRLISTTQTIPLGKWVHVAMSIDLSGGSYLAYFDGVSIPTTTTTTGTITAIVQQAATPLVIGAYATGTEPLDGKVAQAAVYSAIVSAANIRATMSQGLTGSETNIISAFSLDNSLNDLAATANNLTAGGGALATATDTPFAGGSVGTTEYGIVTAASFSTNTTLTVQVPEGYAIPTTGGVSAVSYSITKIPYGFPVDNNRWVVETRGLNGSQSYTTGDIPYKIASAPVGKWKASYSIPLVTSGNASHSVRSSVGLQTSSTNYVESYCGANIQLTTGSTSNITTINYQNDVFIELASATDLNLKVISTAGSLSGYTTRGIYGEPKIILELAYL